jgi:hypothetical protein
MVLAVNTESVAPLLLEQLFYYLGPQIPGQDIAVAWQPREPADLPGVRLLRYGSRPSSGLAGAVRFSPSKLIQKR